MAIEIGSESYPKAHPWLILKSISTLLPFFSNSEEWLRLRPKAPEAWEQKWKGYQVEGHGGEGGIRTLDTC